MRNTQLFCAEHYSLGRCSRFPRRAWWPCTACRRYGQLGHTFLSLSLSLCLSPSLSLYLFWLSLFYFSLSLAVLSLHFLLSLFQSLFIDSFSLFLSLYSLGRCSRFPRRAWWPCIVCRRYGQLVRTFRLTATSPPRILWRGAPPSVSGTSPRQHDVVTEHFPLHAGYVAAEADLNGMESIRTRNKEEEAISKSLLLLVVVIVVSECGNSRIRYNELLNIIQLSLR